MIPLLPSCWPIYSVSFHWNLVSCCVFMLRWKLENRYTGLFCHLDNLFSLWYFNPLSIRSTLTTSDTLFFSHEDNILRNDLTLCLRLGTWIYFLLSLCTKKEENEPVLKRAFLPSFLILPRKNSFFSFYLFILNYRYSPLLSLADAFKHNISAQMHSLNQWKWIKLVPSGRIN